MRPLCTCHGVPMHRNGKTRAGNPSWACAVKRLGRGGRSHTQVRAWKQRNKEKVRAQQARYRERRAEEIRVRDRVRDKDPARTAKRNQSRRAKVRGVPHEPWTRDQVYERGQGRCHICSEPLPKDWHVDHVVPLAAGGPDLLENLLPACPGCNCRKGMALDPCSKGPPGALQEVNGASLRPNEGVTSAHRL
jgi:5-methylcytosine-specific restriction endonuclease McrA